MKHNKFLMISAALATLACAVPAGVNASDPQMADESSATQSPYRGVSESTLVANIHGQKDLNEKLRKSIIQKLELGQKSLNETISSVGKANLDAKQIIETWHTKFYSEKIHSSKTTDAHENVVSETDNLHLLVGSSSHCSGLVAFKNMKDVYPNTPVSVLSINVIGQEDLIEVLRSNISAKLISGYPQIEKMITLAKQAGVDSNPMVEEWHNQFFKDKVLFNTMLEYLGKTPVSEAKKSCLQEYECKNIISKLLKVPYSNWPSTQEVYPNLGLEEGGAKQYLQTFSDAMKQAQSANLKLILGEK